MAGLILGSFKDSILLTYHELQEAFDVDPPSPGTDAEEPDIKSPLISTQQDSIAKALCDGSLALGSFKDGIVLTYNEFHDAFWSESPFPDANTEELNAESPPDIVPPPFATEAPCEEAPAQNASLQPSNGHHEAFKYQLLRSSKSVDSLITHCPRVPVLRRSKARHSEPTTARVLSRKLLRQSELDLHLTTPLSRPWTRACTSQ